MTVQTVRRVQAVAASVLSLAVVVGCSGSDGDGEKPAAEKSTSPIGASPSSSPNPSAPVQLGDPDEGPDEYWPQDGNAGTDALHYDIRVSYDFASGQLRGDSTVTMQAAADLDEFSLDLLLPVKEVEVDGVAADFDTSETHEVLITPDASIAAGNRFKVRVAYEGVPTDFDYDGENSWIADDREVVTMNEPHMAPWWFPSNDHPTDKARFDVRVTVPKAKVVIGNGTQMSRRVRGDVATTHWRSTDPMTTYLAYFAAGNYVVETGTSSGGIPFTNAVSRQLSASERRNALRMLRLSGPITDWLVQRFGPYPFDSTGGLVTGLDVGFALENQTRPTYGSWIYPSVVVHELAHQWFGDSVSVERWSDIWLNEGFATYVEADYAAEHGGPSVKTWLRNRYGANCGSPSSAFWSLDLSDPGADDIFNPAVYERGAMVVAALRNRVGEADFAEMLRGWVRTREDSNATVADFEEWAEKVSGEDLAGFFDAWLRGGKAPAATSDNGLDRDCA